MRNCLNDILNENCLLTLAQINQELRQRLPRKPTIHDRKVAKERLSQARLNLDLNDHVIFIYDGTPAHNHPAIPGPNSELKKLPPYSPFLNIVEQAISALKAAIKADISRPEQQEQMNNRAEARRQGIALGNYCTQLPD